MSNYLLQSGDKGTLYVPRAAIWTSPNTYLEPDLFYVSAETESHLQPNYRTTADLVIEVISVGSAIYDRNTRADTYAALEVRELWLVDEHNKTIEVRVLRENRLQPGEVASGDERISSRVLAGFSFSADEVA
jgi:Uma2 family endonuclease